MGPKQDDSKGCEPLPVYVNIPFTLGGIFWIPGTGRPAGDYSERGQGGNRFYKYLTGRGIGGNLGNNRYYATAKKIQDWQRKGRFFNSHS
jgi:hypothetical protein